MGFPGRGAHYAESGVASNQLAATDKSPHSYPPLVYLDPDGKMWLREKGSFIPVKPRLDVFGNLHVGCTIVSKEALDKIVEMIRQ